MDIPLDEVIHFDGISSSSTGAAADADSTPTFAVYEESTDTDIGVGGNMTKRTSLTGNYRGSFTASAANGFEVGKWYNVIGSATIGGIATKGVLKSFRIVLAEAVAGAPKIDVTYLLGTAWLTPGTAGTPDVNTKLAGGTAWGSGAITAAVIADGAIDAATFAADTVLAPIRTGTLQAGGTTSVTLDASASATDDFYNDRPIYFTGGAGAGQIAWVSDYTGSTKVAALKPTLLVTTDGTTTFAVLPAASVWHQVAADHAVSGSFGAHLTGDSYAIVSSGTHGNAAIKGFVDDIGVAGAGLTALGDARIANLDATVSSRLATAGYTAPTNLTAAQIATGVWQDATAGDFTVASSIGKSLYIDNVAPGGSGGHFISGSNAGTTTFGALTVTGATTLTGNVSLGGTLTVTGATTLGGLATGALSCTTFTASGAVAFQSTFAVTTSTSLAALSCTTLTASGAVALQSTVTVTGATTLTGALTATNASNNLTLGTFTVTTNAIAWNAAWDAEVQSEVVDGLAETVPDTIPADGTRPSVQSGIYMMNQFLIECAISGTTITVKKPDGSTTLFTVTLDSATTPTSKTRAT